MLAVADASSGAGDGVEVAVAPGRGNVDEPLLHPAASATSSAPAAASEHKDMTEGRIAFLGWVHDDQENRQDSATTLERRAARQEWGIPYLCPGEGRRGVANTSGGNESGN